MKYRYSTICVVVVCFGLVALGVYSELSRHSYVLAVLAVMAGAAIGGLLAMRDTPMAVRRFPLEEYRPGDDDEEPS